MSDQTGESYRKEWKTVDTLQNKGLPRSALEVVDRIYQMAKAAGNTTQVIKALVFRAELQASFQEDALVTQIGKFEEELAQSGFPADALLQSILAGMYWQYYQNNRYRILDRTVTAGAQSDDLQTWDARKFVEKVTALYQASLARAQELRRLPLQQFDAILDSEPGSRKFRPTLFDLLAHRAVDFFENDESDLTRPAAQFHLRGPAPFLPAAEFVNQAFETTDTLSMVFRATRILQQILAAHLEEEDPVPLVDADLRRLRFVHSHSVDVQKDTLYVTALKELSGRFAGHPVSASVTYELASHYAQRGEAYHPRQAEGAKWHRRTAYRLCQQAISRFPDSEGAQNCRALQARIASKSLSLTLESVNLPDQPFRGLLEFRNVNKIYLRAAAVSPEELERKRKTRNFDTEKAIEYFLSLPAAATWEETLPDDGDYNEHAVEIKIPALPRGFYALLVGTDGGFSRQGQAVAAAATSVSRLGYIEKSDPDPTRDGLWVFDRESGAPLKGVSIRLTTRKYNDEERRYEDLSSPPQTTDAEGFFAMQSVSADFRNTRVRYDLRYRDDRLYLDKSGYFSSSGRGSGRERPVVRTFFFTDRSIYRPGQTVYFKGIMVRSEADSSRIVAGQKSTVTFLDVNRQKIAELSLITNDYGTFSGTFTVPQGALTGEMSISNESGRTVISVEEYKRPRFEVTFLPVKGSFRLGENVTVRGKAAAYAGANIDNAEVQFRVVRETFFPFFWDYWLRPPFSAEKTEIINGVTRSDASGEFEITFAAEPDPRIPEKDLPSFSFTVYADVTDVGGETHSSRVVVSVGYAALAVEAAIAENINRNAAPPLRIRTANLNGEFEPAAGTVEVYRLEEPQRVLRPRLWSPPDRFLITREDYAQAFPHDVYDNEDDFHTWPQQQRMLVEAFDTGKSDSLLLKGISGWPEGRYRLDLQTRDRFGREITLRRFFTLFAPQEKTLPEPALLWNTALKSGGEPGETAEILWGCAAGDVRALLTIFRRGQAPQSRWVNAGSRKNRLRLPIGPEDRGNFGYSLLFVKWGRVQQLEGTVEVPWSNKELQITYQTFRDKLQPGQPEEWRLKISGPQKERVAAEMVAGMYDASLDALKPHDWEFSIYPRFSGTYGWQLRSGAAFGSDQFGASGEDWNPLLQFVYHRYDELRVPQFGYGGFIYLMRKSAGDASPAPAAFDHAGGIQQAGSPEEARDGAAEEEPAEAEVTVRSNLNETAFFFPELRTNEEGEIVLAFTMPEALTRWKLLGFAHTKDLKYALTEKTVVTQKELMVVPNAPRFLREGDRLLFTGKVSNLTESAVTGTARLQLLDAITLKPLDAALGNTRPEIPFSAAAGQSAPLSWSLQVPEGLQAVTYRITARSAAFSDGEESTLPVLTNRTLVTETLPLPIRGAGSKQFTLDKLLQSGKSSTLRHQRLTLEFTSNPAWYAVQALPYLMEYPYECSEQIFNRYYANSIAAWIVRSNPKIKRVFEQWKGDGALKSNLEKNAELKAVLLQETPWVLQAQDESERKKRVALLFDVNKMALELDGAARKLAQMQLANGAWPWFPEMHENRYITQYILAGMGHLRRLGVADVTAGPAGSSMLQKALAYLDEQMDRDYRRLLEQERDMKEMQISSLLIHYLYARSFFGDIPVAEQYGEAFRYWQSQAARYWLQQSLYTQGMIALALQRLGDRQVPAEIVASLREHALHSEEFGMYWAENNGGYYWYQAPIETHSLLMEVFQDVAADQQAVDELKIWLLKQKQTQDWRTTKATADACYALLLQGSDWLAGDELVTVTLGDSEVDPRQLPSGERPEAGSGYFKTSWGRGEIQPQMGRVTVTKADQGPAWGALYWQYFEQLDRITPHETPLQLSKQLFVERPSPSGPQLHPVADDTPLQPGDLLKVRIELRVDRNLEYVHMKDMRASGLEPLNVLSQYHYQGGLGYYQATGDAATNFFFAWLPRGTYVFEYPLRVTHSGDFSNGITTIQCMYAPEFAAHSRGVRLRVQNSGK